MVFTLESKLRSKDTQPILFRGCIALCQRLPSNLIRSPIANERISNDENRKVKDYDFGNARQTRKRNERRGEIVDHVTRRRSEIIQLSVECVFKPLPVWLRAL